MSGASSSNSPAGGLATAGHSSGSTMAAPASRSRHGRRIAISPAPSNASPCAHSGAAGNHQTAPGSAVSSLSQPISSPTSQAATAHSGGATPPSSASGVMTKLINGMASRLASSPTRESWAKQIRLSGARPTVAMACVRKTALSRARQPSVRSPPVIISRPTAPKDSQKPGCSKAHGSTAVTTTAAASSTSGQGQRRPSDCRLATAASISTVRWAGTPQPENIA
jgi:hypothetical protein